jgi:hypothetical protein
MSDVLAPMQTFAEVYGRPALVEGADVPPVERPAGVPPGVELWPAGTPTRPIPGPAMFHGCIGEFARTCPEHSEADPVAVLTQALTLYGVAVGGGPYVLAGNERHPAALHTLIVGRSAKGGKGTSWAVARDLIKRVDPAILGRVKSGFGSGEALIAELAPDPKGDVPDHRLLVHEVEFGGVLARCRRETSTLATTMRAAWDGGPLSNRTTGNGRLVAEGHHVGAVAHITADELRLRLTDVDIFGGTVNRWLHVWCERGRLFPEGGNVPADVLDGFAKQLRENVPKARRAGLVTRTPAAGEVWKELYADVSDDDPPGVLGHVLGRAAPQCLRLSLVYALADGKGSIDVDHVLAARALWAYARASAAHIHGESVGDAQADALLAALRLAGAEGIDATAGNKLINNRTGVFDGAREYLERLGLAITLDVPVARGRPRKVTYAVRPAGRR